MVVSEVASQGSWRRRREACLRGEKKKPKAFGTIIVVSQIRNLSLGRIKWLL